MKGRSGLATISAIVAMVFLAISLTAVSYKATGSTHNVTAQEQMTAAKTAADAGIQRVNISLKQAAESWNANINTASVNWSWLEQALNTRNFQTLTNDNQSAYSVSIHQGDDEKGPIVTNLNTKTPGTYTIVSVGRSTYGLNAVTTTTTSKLVITNTAGNKGDDKTGRGGVFKYIVDTVRNAEGRVAKRDSDQWKWIRAPGLKYNADSWNGIAELMLQEQATSIDSSWKPIYEVDTFNKYGQLTHQEGDNWAYGNNRTNPSTNQLKNWFLNNTGETAYKDFLSTYFDLSTVQESQISSLFKNPFKAPNSNYNNGTPAVIGGMPSISNTSMRNDFDKTNYPPFIALTNSSDYNPQTMFNKIQSIKRNGNAWYQIWPVLGSVIVYRDETRATDKYNPIYIYEIHVDQLTSSPYTISDVYIFNPLNGKIATTLDDVKEPDHINPASTPRAVEVIYFTQDGTYPK